MLTKEQMQGMWVSVPTEWDEDDNFDEKSFRDVIAKLIDVGAHALYTTGSTGEFYALDWDEFKQVTDVFFAGLDISQRPKCIKRKDQQGEGDSNPKISGYQYV